MVQAIGIHRHIRIPIEGANRYRHALPQPIAIPIKNIQGAVVQGLINKLRPCVYVFHIKPFHGNLSTFKKKDAFFFLNAMESKKKPFFWNAMESSTEQHATLIRGRVEA